ncbi:amidohydrolase family protein [Geodermatophilus sp. DSM 44513]|uniref:amidohydrolase family protein n=1 Tax=Geodermatophilus sp. DSM 44513 TaxID=1528104 RepID=UPI0012819FA4|nr:amidohydrolase family protein [Geodermatophilus sp. DSM 44513]WNV77094.1 amidohydrolase family protein [Geodermatophilus sp. DSM 44513]
MIDGTFVVDAVSHGLHFARDNQVAPRSYSDGVGSHEYRRIHQSLSPRGRPEWLLDEDRWLHGADPEMLAHCLFAESWTDFTVYHGVPQYGVFRDGGSPLWVGVEMRAALPGRVALYGPVSPFAPDAVDQVDRLVDEHGVVGVKFYPVDLVQGRVESFRMDDPERLYPVYERCRARGVKVVAVHKAIPLGRFPAAPYRVEDVEAAAATFPDLVFEVVHGGSAFVEETRLLLARFPNVVVNLEGTSAYLNNAPRKFAHVIGAFLGDYGTEDRIVWATGTSALHPQPLLEAFWDLKMPEDLLEYGCAPLTREVKEKILGRNALQMLGLDIDELRARTAGDRFSSTELAAPWSGGPLAVGR